MVSSVFGEEISNEYSCDLIRGNKIEKEVFSTWFEKFVTIILQLRANCLAILKPCSQIKTM